MICSQRYSFCLQGIWRAACTRLTWPKWRNPCWLWATSGGGAERDGNGWKLRRHRQIWRRAECYRGCGKWVREAKGWAQQRCGEFNKEWKQRNHRRRVGRTHFSGEWAGCPSRGSRKVTLNPFPFVFYVLFWELWFCLRQGEDHDLTRNQILDSTCYMFSSHIAESEEMQEQSAELLTLFRRPPQRDLEEIIRKMTVEEIESVINPPSHAAPLFCLMMKMTVMMMWSVQGLLNSCLKLKP